jgi:GTP-binding protein
VSQTPGRTQQINFFNLGGKLILVDLPGYGYAKASRTLAMDWQTMIFAYLGGRATLARALLLIDARRGLMQSDLAVMELLDRAAVSYELVLTKSDEQTQAGLEAAQADLAAEARKHTAALAQMAATSAQTGAGIAEFQSQLAALAH